MIFSFDGPSIRVEPSHVLSLVGYPDPGAASLRVREAVPKLVEEMSTVARPVALVRLETVAGVGAENVRIAGGPCFSGKLLAGAFAPAEKAAVFALTLGREAVDRLRARFAEDGWAGFLLDAISSVLVESAADRLERRLAEVVSADGLHPGPRYSPGYCDWPVAEMPRLLAWVGSERIGVSLTSGGMMVPEKSICGMIGLARDARAIRRVPCKVCSRADCLHRRGDRDPVVAPGAGSSLLARLAGPRSPGSPTMR